MIACLEQLIQTVDYKGESARLLAPYYRRTEQVEHQVFALQILAEEQDIQTVEGLNTKVSYLHEVAELFLNAGAIQEAYDTYQQAFFVDPRSDESLQGERKKENNGKVEKSKKLN